MWLLPVFSRVAALAVRAFYHVERAGEPVPATGPLLLVANHPNSLLDPAMIAAVAWRPVRFLAKAPLFSDRRVGWLVRASGAVPVFRPADDPAQTGRNREVFRAVEEALGAGHAVGIFPEGTSHSAPGLAPLRTGAARIALGAARSGAPPVILPFGLSFRDKGRFRSAALVLAGPPVPWSDLHARGPDDSQAVRALTARIEDALRPLAPNLERWEDAPLLECAEAIHAAEYDVSPDPALRMERLRIAAEALAGLRRGAHSGWQAVAREVRSHGRTLRALGLAPHELYSAPRFGVAAEWALRQAAFFGIGAPLALLGAAAYALPYQATGLLVDRARPEPDVRATQKLLLGVVLHVAWTVGLALAAGIAWGWRAALAMLVLLPVSGAVALHVGDRWDTARGEFHRYWVRLRRRAPLVHLRARQREIAGRLHELWRGVEG